MRAPHTLRGFTLIEITVVMLIIVIVLGVVSTNLAPDRETAVRDEAKRLALLINTAQQEAILQAKLLAVKFDSQGYSFQYLNEENEFQPLPRDEILYPRVLAPEVIISSVNIDGAPEDETPRLLLLPSGELPAFTITFARDEFRWEVQGMFTGEITAQAAPSPENV